MNSRLQLFTRTVWVLALTTLIVSCQDTIPKRSLIESGSITDIECPEGQKLVDTDEKNEDGETIQICKEIALVRPTDSVSWNTDFCICKNSKPVSYGNCSSFCAGKPNSEAEVLYATFKLGPNILLNKELETLYNWCQKPFSTDQDNPACVIEAKDDQGNVSVISELNISTTSASINTNVQNILTNDKTYVLTLIEKTSGAKSDSIQLIKFSQDMSLPILGPLKNVPVSQYTCLIKTFDSNNNTVDAYPLHFYFLPRLTPDKVPAGQQMVVCHDTVLYGTKDQDNIPRLETVPGVFNMWDETDPRFYDNNGNTLMDIHEAIIQKTKNFGATIPSTSKFFHQFKWQNSLEYETSNGDKNDPMKSLGYFMAPWIDQTTYKSYCLNNTHYNSTNALFKAIRDYVGVETEGLYVGVRSPEEIKVEDEVSESLPDYLLIRETDLKAVWFYYKAGVPTAPTEDNVANNTIFFHYPLNKVSPFVRTSTQKLFKLKHMSELNSTTSSSGSTSSGGLTSYPTHDRKFGCIPKF